MSYNMPEPYEYTQNDAQQDKKFSALNQIFQTLSSASNIVAKRETLSNTDFIRFV